MQYIETNHIYISTITHWPIWLYCGFVAKIIILFSTFQYRLEFNYVLWYLSMRFISAIFKIATIIITILFKFCCRITVCFVSFIFMDELQQDYKLNILHVTKSINSNEINTYCVPTISTSHKCWKSKKYVLIWLRQDLNLHGCELFSGLWISRSI